MKKALTIGLAGVALVVTLSLVAADSFKREQTIATDVLPANEILTTVRSMGLDPIGEPLRRGPYYVLHAYDPRGVEVRVVADAQLGDILSVTPARALNDAYAPSYERGPRIIHIPQRGERDGRASIDDRDQPDAVGNDDGEPVMPPLRHRTTPHAEGPTPIRPTPRFKAMVDKINKSSMPDDTAAASEPSTPPADNRPPAALLHGN